MKDKDLIAALKIRLQEAKDMKKTLDKSSAPYVTLRWRYGYYDGKIRVLEELLSDLKGKKDCICDPIEGKCDYHRVTG